MKNRILLFVSPTNGRNYPIHCEDFADESEHIVLETFGSTVLAHSGRHGDTGSPVTGWAS